MIKLEPVRIADEDDRRKIELLHLASKGKLANIVDGEVAVFTLKGPEKVLGNHYHEYTEFLAFLSGSAKLILEDIQTKKRETLEMSPRQKVYIPPFTGIALRGDEGSEVLVIRERPYSNETTHPYVMGD